MLKNHIKRMAISETDIYTPMFDENPDFYTAFLDVVGEEWFINAVNIESKRIRQHMKSTKSDEYSILDIGAATGASLIRLLTLLKPSTKKEIRLDWLDPSQECLRKFKKRAEQSRIQGSLNNYFIEKWEEHNPEIRYDYIRAIESWFGIEDWSKSLMKFYDSLKTGGLGLILIESKENDFVKFKMEFCPRLFPDYTAVYGEEVCKALDELGIPYSKEKVMISEADIGCCIPEPNLKGKRFLSYLLRHDFEELPASLKNEITDYLKNKYPSKVFKLFNDFIWIEKQ